MTRQPGRPVALGLRLYRALASAFPHEFKNVYGEEMVQTAEDAIEPVWKHHGLAGLLRLLFDIAVRIPVEYASEMRQDVRYGLRVLAQSPGFTAVALVSLTLGIGVTTAAFSDVSGMILRDVAGVEKPDQLVTLERPTSYPAYLRYRERTDLFESTLAYAAPVPFGVWADGRTERTWGHIVSPSYFSTLGVRPALGRLPGEEPEQPGQQAAVVVSYRFWQNRLGADSAVIGKSLRVDGHPCTIAGVGPKDFHGASPMVFGADLWMPLSAGELVAPELANHALERRDLTLFQFVGRLRPGVTESRVEAELDTVARQLEQAYGEEDKEHKGRRLAVLPGGKLIPVPKQQRPVLTSVFTLLGAMVLLIACSNVANMMIARAAGRRREIAVRLALGASRMRLIRQLLTESMLLAAVAGVLGLLAASWLLRVGSQIRIPYPMPIAIDITPDSGVMLFTVVLTLATGIGFGLAPAFEATRADLAPALKEGGNVRFRRYRRLSLRNVLVLSQVAGSLTLLLLTAFLVIGYQRSYVVRLGFQPKNVYKLSIDPIHDGYSGEQAAAFFDKLIDRVNALPSVVSASLTHYVPMSFAGGGSVSFSAVASGKGELPQIRSAHRSVVGRNFFETVGLPVLRGRGFRKEDEKGNARVVVVSEKLGREFWDAGANGRRIEIGGARDAPFRFGITLSDPLGAISNDRRAYQVVGVVGNEQRKDARSQLTERPMVYFPLRPADLSHPSVEGITLLVRAVPGVDVLAAVRREIAALDSNLASFDARSMEEHVEQALFPFLSAIWSYGILGVCGLILATVGLAGVTAYSVTRRGREIGIRVALGAQKRDVLGLVMKEGLSLVAAGTVFGLAGGWAGRRLIAWFMPTAASFASEPWIVLGAPALLAALALASCYLPARSSTRIDPVVALRQE